MNTTLHPDPQQVLPSQINVGLPDWRERHQTRIVISALADHLHLTDQYLTDTPPGRKRLLRDSGLELRVDVGEGRE